MLEILEWENSKKKEGYIMQKHSCKLISYDGEWG